MTPACPKCRSAKVHHSRRRGVAERLIALAGFKVRRCHECNLRFATLGGSTLLGADIQKALRKFYFLAVMVAALVMVLSLVLWFGGKQASYSPAETGASPPVAVGLSIPA